MDLNNIELSSFTLATLYKKTLVDPGTNNASIQPDLLKKESTTAKSSWKYSGNNLRQILVVVDSGDGDITQEENELLISMFSACQLSPEDLAIVKRSDHLAEDYKSMTSHFKSRVIFLFGIEPVSFGLPVSFPEFQVQKFASLTFLCAPRLLELKQDKLLKSKLWLCLKRIFTL